MKTIKAKITFFVTWICFILSISLGIISIVQSSTSLNKKTQDEMMILAEQVSDTVEESLDSDFSFLEGVASNPLVCDVNADPMEQKKFLMDLAKKRGVNDMGVANAEGKTMTAALDVMADVSERAYFKESIKGNRAASDPIEDSTKPGVMIMMMSVPIYNDGNIVGVLYMLADGAYLSNITNKVEFGETGSAYMINGEGTNIAHPNEEKVIKQENAIKMFSNDPAFSGLIKTLNKILEGGNGYDEYSYEGVSKCVGYSEVENTSWHVVVSAAYDEMFEGNKSIKDGIFAVAIIEALAFSIIGYLIAGKMMKPIGNVVDELTQISEGDLSKEVPDSLMKRKDELGKLGRALEKTRQALRHTIGEVNAKSEQVIGFSESQTHRIDELLSNVESVSANSTEISASTEEVAASTEQMTIDSSGVMQAAESIAQMAGEGAKTAEGISKRAKNLRETTTESRENAINVCNESVDVLKKAIENSRKVEEINQLSNAILSIASQTNLLALNASIEAARAGEAGKGFAVVATEIGTLADESQKSVTQIMDVTKEVIGSVEHLSKCATEILDFLQGTVMEDYSRMVETSEYYNNDAKSIEDMVTNLSETTGTLMNTIAEMVNKINQVSAAIEESAQGITNIAEHNGDISCKIESVVELSKEAETAAIELAKLVSIFRI